MAPPPYRCFLALDCPESSRERVCQLQRSLGARLEGVSWSRPENLHLTLLFLGQVFEDGLARLTPRLRRLAARTPALSLQLGDAGHFPRDPRRPARVLWLGVRGEVERLQTLAAELRTAGREAGLDVSSEPFHPHLTLGRVRSPGRHGAAAGRALAELESGEIGPLGGEGFSLYQSLAAEQGVGYRALERFRLRADPSG